MTDSFHILSSSHIRFLPWSNDSIRSISSSFLSSDVLIACVIRLEFSRKRTDSRRDVKPRDKWKFGYINSRSNLNANLYNRNTPSLEDKSYDDRISGNAMRFLSLNKIGRYGETGCSAVRNFNFIWGKKKSVCSIILRVTTLNAKKKRKTRYTVRSPKVRMSGRLFEGISKVTYLSLSLSLSVSRSIYPGFPGWYVDERAPARTYAFYEDNKN